MDIIENLEYEFMTICLNLIENAYNSTLIFQGAKYNKLRSYMYLVLGECKAIITMINARNAVKNENNENK